MKYLLTAVVTLVLCSCATPPRGDCTEEEITDYERAVAEYEKYSSMETPASWGVGNSWIFIYVKDDRIINRIIVEPTTENVPWISDWKVLKVLFEESPMNFEHFSNIVSAYEVKGTLLFIKVAANISHTEWIRGRFSGNGFAGDIVEDQPNCLRPADCSNSVRVYGVPLL